MQTGAKTHMTSAQVKSFQLKQKHMPVLILYDYTYLMGITQGKKITLILI